MFEVSPWNRKRKRVHSTEKQNRWTYCVCFLCDYHLTSLTCPRHTRVMWVLTPRSTLQFTVESCSRQEDFGAVFSFQKSEAYFSRVGSKCTEVGEAIHLFTIGCTPAAHKRQWKEDSSYKEGQWEIKLNTEQQYTMKGIWFRNRGSCGTILFVLEDPYHLHWCWL